MPQESSSVSSAQQKGNVPLPTPGAFALDANVMAHDGWLQAEQQFVWGWGEPVVACVHIQTEAACLTLRSKTPTGEQQQECIRIEYGPANFGVRPLFVCPACDQSYYKLYLRSGRFRCKKCHHLKSPRLEAANGAKAEQRREMSGRPLPALPETPPFAASVWADTAFFAMSERMCCGDETTQRRFKPGARESVAAVHPAKLPGWRGGRPPLSLHDVPCTCGAGDDVNGHRTTCPRGRLIYQRRRRNAPLE